jgi:uncharacterized protein
MSGYPEGEFLLPLFPLPNVVLFPKTRIPLHVFEPRYRQMVADALGSEKRIGLVLLKPGWEADYDGTPDVHELGTVGVIEQVAAFDDGRYNILLNGVVRYRIVEHVNTLPYRIARVVAAPEKVLPAEEAYPLREWLADLSRQYIALLPGEADVSEIGSAPLDALTNAVIMSLDLAMEEKQSLLEQSAIAERAERIGALLSDRISTMELLAPFRRDGDPGSN